MSGCGGLRCLWVRAFSPSVSRRMESQGCSAVARVQRTSAWTWGPFRAVSISRTWASKSFHTASLGGPEAVAPLAKKPEEKRRSPAPRGPRASLGGAAGRGRGAAPRAGRGQPPTAPPPSWIHLPGRLHTAALPRHHLWVT